MPTVLYIISKPPHSWPDYQFVLPSGKNHQGKTVALIENTEITENLNADQIFRVDQEESSQMKKPKPFSLFRIVICWT